MPQARDLPNDPGLEPAPNAGRRGPYVGTPPPRALARMAESKRLDRVLMELHRGFGWMHWWPAETPFEVIVGAILTQNTAWTNVEKALAALKAKGALTPARLLRMKPERLALTIKSSGYFNAKARKLAAVSHWYLGVSGLTALQERPLAPLRESLLEVWGVGPETADSILCYAAGRRTAVVDAYTRRILSRHGFLEHDVPYESMRTWLEERLVDSQFVYEEFHALFARTGYTGCKPTPRCAECPATTPVALR